MGAPMLCSLHSRPGCFSHLATFLEILLCVQPFLEIALCLRIFLEMCLVFLEMFGAYVVGLAFLEIESGRQIV